MNFDGFNEMTNEADYAQKVSQWISVAGELAVKKVSKKHDRNKPRFRVNTLNFADLVSE